MKLDRTEGDPRVHLVLNITLSFLYAMIVVWGLTVLGVLDEFTWTIVLVATVLIAIITHIVVS